MAKGVAEIEQQPFGLVEFIYFDEPALGLRRQAQHFFHTARGQAGGGAQGD